MENATQWPRRVAQFGFWMGILLVGSLVLAGCTQPPQATPTPGYSGANPSPAAYGDDGGSVDSAQADFADMEEWSGQLNQTGDVDDSDMDRVQ